MSDTALDNDVNAGRDRLHLIVALILAALLLLLPFLFKIGPNSWKSCAVSTPVAAAAPAPSAASPAEPVRVEPAPAASQPAVETSPAAAPEPATVAEPAPVAAVEAPPPAARVYFGLDRYSLPGDVEGTLAAVVDYLKRHPGAKVELKGFHDRRGRADHNRMLASNRATSVSDYLIASGIAGDRVVVAQPVETTGTGPHAEARRVEVSVIR
jgi:outer membrane protein OmpA-like peptidoglycan-associated protein